MSKQPIFTPAIVPCAKCGSAARVIDWNYNMQYKVICENNCQHGLGENITAHRAICKWNNTQKALLP